MIFSLSLYAQTDHDAIMMNKSQWCNGASFMQSSWTNYWEGTAKRNNENIGALTTRSVMGMSNYGITDKLNIMAGLSYVSTSASRGTLHGMKGFQDGSVHVKWKPVTLLAGKTRFSVLAVAGISTPVTDYVIDFLPMSIGLGSTNISGRLIGDMQSGIFFTTLSGAYVRRSNVHLDRTSYYTTGIHYTSEVQMPDLALYDVSIGIRKKFLVAEALLTSMTTLGGFDIRKNDMPFPSNRMNTAAAGIHLKYTLPCYTHVELTGDASYVFSGRNAGQAATFGAGGYYVFSFRPTQKQATATNTLP